MFYNDSVIPELLLWVEQRVWLLLPEQPVAVCCQVVDIDSYSVFWPWKLILQDNTAGLTQVPYVITEEGLGMLNKL